jgi:hypothetical protein
VGQSRGGADRRQSQGWEQGEISEREGRTGEARQEDEQICQDVCDGLELGVVFRQAQKNGSGLVVVPESANSRVVQYSTYDLNRAN